MDVINTHLSKWTNPKIKWSEEKKRHYSASFITCLFTLDEIGTENEKGKEKLYELNLSDAAIKNAQGH